MKTPTPRAHRAFTLIELLTVIAIIGILAAILIPTVGAVRNQATTTRCASNLRQIGQAALIYVPENKGYLPLNVTVSGKAWSWAGELKSYVASIAKTGTENQMFFCPTADPELSWAFPGTTGRPDYGQYAVSARLNGDRWPTSDVTLNGETYSYAGQTFPRGVPYSAMKNPSRVVMMGESARNAASSRSIKVTDFFGSGANVNGAAANHRSDLDPTKGDGKSNYLYADGHVVTHSKWPGQAAFEIK
jgi:prepilin-type N-terminal cleavage/methylation domain-containing protein/prepilin-type processing-associated H-X9-DG protein